jgi:hypothetical protein
MILTFGLYVQHGLGVFEFENGRVYRGRFEHDRMVDLPPVDALPVLHIC